ncbi:DUF3526 domain-containing protein [Aureibacter tunicatorum]|uniref:ABC-2 type transport system permease protein n=1 Tax=Aureibacter tunicatorum TaxID=866807 RepID=A0AAE3XU60_9BACT|nr:DUF3526 domain-containing protein [Aureibacter tunicatorum]MDR6242024.1 ABC-2 type transport system permease protein [Aureibacter tunicatorum]BDD07131.1 hypothetical protein AUTU_46140 [Aureibacter tunicatorum]
MKNLLITIIKYEWLKMRRNPWQWLSLLVLAGASWFAFSYGEAEIKHQNETIASIQTSDDKQIDEFINAFAQDTSTSEGLTAYKKAQDPANMRWQLSRHVVSSPSELAQLSLGQRDVYPYYLKFRKNSSYYMQIFQSELNNPFKLLVGHFDFSFVMIYLLPLWIIAIAYNILSSEKDMGTYALLRLQGGSLQFITFYRLMFYFTVTLLCVTLIYMIGINILAIGFSLKIVYFYFGLVAYITCWFGILYLLISLNKDSSFNILSLLSMWVFFLIALPAFSNLIAYSVKKVDNKHLSNIIRRKPIEETPENARNLIWKLSEMEPRLHPIDTSSNTFLIGKAYYAFHAISDMEEKPIVNKYLAQVESRVAWLGYFEWINPAVMIQSICNQLAHTDYDAHAHFMEQSQSFHDMMNMISLKKLMKDQFLEKEDYQRLRDASLAGYEENTGLLLGRIFWLMIMGVALFYFGQYNLKKAH